MAISGALVRFPMSLIGCGLRCAALGPRGRITAFQIQGWVVCRDCVLQMRFGCCLKSVLLGRDGLAADLCFVCLVRMRHDSLRWWSSGISDMRSKCSCVLLLL